MKCGAGLWAVLLLCVGVINGQEFRTGEPVSELALLADSSDNAEDVHDLDFLGNPVEDYRGWRRYSPMWCTIPYRRRIGTTSSYSACIRLCLQKNRNCKAVEWWQKKPYQYCFQCLNPSKRRRYTNTRDLAYPPHVLVKTSIKPPKPLGWRRYSPMWCTIRYRRRIGTTSSYSACISLCLRKNRNCKAVEWWQKRPYQYCFECLDPSKRRPYTNTRDLAYPPHVLVRPYNPLVWKDFKYMWCTTRYRSRKLGLSSSGRSCKLLCLRKNRNCKAVEWWEKTRSCYQCYNPSKRRSYTNKKDRGYPPHVIVKPPYYGDEPPVEGTEGLEDEQTKHADQDPSVGDMERRLEDYDTLVDESSRKSIESNEDPLVCGAGGKLEDYDTLAEESARKSLESNEDPPVEGNPAGKLEDYPAQEDDRNTYDEPPIGGKGLTDTSDIPDDVSEDPEENDKQGPPVGGKGLTDSDTREDVSADPEENDKQELPVAGREG